VQKDYQRYGVHILKWVSSEHQCFWVLYPAYSNCSAGVLFHTHIIGRLYRQKCQRGYRYYLQQISINRVSTRLLLHPGYSKCFPKTLTHNQTISCLKEQKCYRRYLNHLLKMSANAASVVNVGTQ
jgi:hypothetical protein